jgi:stage V sporulation protein D (sporulation-specific penicillin-binding protein)
MAGSQNRLRIITLGLLLFAFILVSKLYFVQIISGDEFEARAEHQYVAGVNFFDRGSIYFSTKDGTLVPAANIKMGFTLSINPKITTLYDTLPEMAEAINFITPIDKEIFLIKAHKENDPYEEIAKRLDEETAKAIQALELPGVSVTRDRWRNYPGENMAAHAIGLIGYDSGNTLAGRYGLERYYEETLGREGDEVFVNFFAEIFSNIKSVVRDGESLEGDIVTTLEPSVEAFLESEIEKVTNHYASDFTGGIVIDPNTGEIKAMAITPAFDPNSPQDAPNSSVFSNKLVEDRYEMGSIIKALTFGIGLETKVITPKTTYNDPGCITLNTKTFCNYDGQSHGTRVTMQEALNNSLNTGAAFVAEKVGNRRFSDYMLKFGLEEKTGIDLPNEGNSLVSNLKTLRDLELAQASFGQGIALTPVNTVRALSALANGGTLITPHLVKEVQYKIGPSRTLKHPSENDRDRVISKEASSEISRMLVEVVDRSLRFGQMRLENYSVAAKTGTAQIANPAGGGYYADRYLHSFFGYFPAYDPEFLVFLFTYHPKEVQYASETLTDAFFNTTKFLINYYDIPPDREAPPASPVALSF